MYFVIFPNRPVTANSRPMMSATIHAGVELYERDECRRAASNDGAPSAISAPPRPLRMYFVIFPNRRYEIFETFAVSRATLTSVTRALRRAWKRR